MKFNHPTIVTITAPTCSGKSYLLDELIRRGIFSRIISTTTRAPRPGEANGIDYYFISDLVSREMEREGLFFELVEFNGVRYGVTNEEMRQKMQLGPAPVVILEPAGLSIYKQKCVELGWDIFKIYVHAVENLRLERLRTRVIESISRDVSAAVGSVSAAGRYLEALHGASIERLMKQIEKHISHYEMRLLSITGEERRWQNIDNWDAIVPGDNVEKAIEMIEQGIKWRNRQREEPQAIGAVKLPI